MNTSIRGRLLFEPTYFSINAISLQTTIPTGPVFGTGKKLGSRRTGNGALCRVAANTQDNEAFRGLNINNE